MNHAQPKPILSVENLVKNYGSFKAVNNISFQVYEGEVFGILGPNGAGKTTTLEIIETLTPKTSGQVTIMDLNLDLHQDQIKSKIGIQLQSGGFFPDLTLIEILNLFADTYNVTIQPQKFLEQFNLADKAKSTVEKLSGGQRQRFSIATTLIADPQIIFLDEPTTGLDPQARRNLWEAIKELQELGKTIIITTHYMDEAEYLCDRVAIMDQGQILQIETPKHLIESLLNRGFSKPTPVLAANLEDVFLDLTGKTLRE